MRTAVLRQSDQKKTGNLKDVKYTMKSTSINWKQVGKNLGILLMICGVYYAVTYVTGCPIRFFLGISCPGCGMTRAWVAVLHLDFAEAFTLHPLFPLAPLIAAAFVFGDWIDFSRFRWAVVLIAVLFIAVYLIRLIFFPGEPVVFQPREGLIFRFFSLLLTPFSG